MDCITLACIVYYKRNRVALANNDSISNEKTFVNFLFVHLAELYRIKSLRIIVNGIWQLRVLQQIIMTIVVLCVKGYISATLRRTQKVMIVQNAFCIRHLHRI